MLAITTKLLDKIIFILYILPIYYIFALKSAVQGLCAYISPFLLLLHMIFFNKNIFISFFIFQKLQYPHCVFYSLSGLFLKYFWIITTFQPMYCIDYLLFSSEIPEAKHPFSKRQNIFRFLFKYSRAATLCMQRP